MAVSASGDFETANYPAATGTYVKRVGVSWNGSFNETTLKWDISWSATAQGGGYSTSRNTAFSRSVVVKNGSTTVTSVSATESTGLVYNNDVLLSGSFSVAPNTDGSLSLTFSASCVYYTSAGGSNYTSSGSKTFALPVVAIASQISVANQSITISTVSGTVGYTVTSKDKYYHKLKFGVTYDTASVIFSAKEINNTTFSGTVNVSDIISLVPNQSGTVYFYLDTFRDSAQTKQLGTTAIGSLNVTVDTTKIKPTLTLTNITATDTPISGYFVAGYSSGGCSGVTANPGTGSVISRIDYTVANGTIRTDGYSVTGSDRNLVFSKVPASTSNYTVTLKAVAYDQRGAASAEQTKTVTVYGYELPKITTNIYRVANSGDTEEDYGGEYVRINYTGVVSSSVNGQNSVQSTVCTSGSTTYQNNTYPTLGGDYSATFKVVCTDKVASATATVNIGRAVFPMSLYDDLQGDVGVIFGGWTKFRGVADMDIPLPATSGGTGYNSITAFINAICTDYYDTQSTTSASAAETAKVYTVVGSGIVIASATTVTGMDNDYGSTGARILKNDVLYAYNTNRVDVATTYQLGANCVAVMKVVNGDKISLGGFSTKVGTKNLYRVLLAIGCTLTTS